MANVKPVKSWKPGQSGNPKGAPKKEDRLSRKIDALFELPYQEFKEMAERVTRGETEGYLVKDVVAMQYTLKVAKGDMRYVMDHRDRTEGKATQSIQLDGNLDVRTQIDETTKQLSKLFG
jgi:hypothetical protein